MIITTNLIFLQSLLFRDATFLQASGLFSQSRDSNSFAGSFNSGIHWELSPFFYSRFPSVVFWNRRYLSCLAHFFVWWLPPLSSWVLPYAERMSIIMAVIFWWIFLCSFMNAQRDMISSSRAVKAVLGWPLPPPRLGWCGAKDSSSSKTLVTHFSRGGSHRGACARVSGDSRKIELLLNGSADGWWCPAWSEVGSRLQSGTKKVDFHFHLKSSCSLESFVLLLVKLLL